MREIQHVHEASPMTQRTRLAHRHPNHSPVEPDVIDAYDRAEAAVRLLESWATRQPRGTLPTEALPDVVEAYEHLSDLVWDLPKVRGFVCGYDLSASGLGNARNTRTSRSQFSAHVTRTEAERWLEGWKSGGIRGDWEVFEDEPANVILFREEDLPDDEIARATRKAL